MRSFHTHGRRDGIVLSDDTGIRTLPKMKLIVQLLLLLVLKSIESYVYISPKILSRPKFVSRAGNINLKKDDGLNLELDTSKLSEEERTRLEYIQKVTREADEFAKLGGFYGSDEDREEVERDVIDTKWSGQSEMEITLTSSNTPLDVINRPILAIGDVAMLWLFSSIGRANHNEGLNIADTASTAAPFLATWLAISPFLGTYSRQATSSRGKVISGVLAGWIVSIPAALAIRGYIKDYMPPTPFIIVSMVSTFILLSAWRLLYIEAFGETSDNEYRKAGFLEVFKMIGTLIRRW